MRNAKTLMVALVAVFALSAVAASAAKPQFTKTGVTFASVSGPAVLEAAAGNIVKCESDTIAGTVTAAKKVEKVVVHFFNCTCSGGGEGHSTIPLGATGEIITNSLKGTLGYISTGPETGLTLEPEVSKGLLTKIVCAIGGLPIALEVKGAVTGVITPLNTLTSTFTLTFTQSGGMQTPLADTLMVSFGGGAFEKAGLQTADTLKMATSMEIEA
jgi:hypothetical protein